jgi:hypothetical protein
MVMRETVVDAEVYIRNTQEPIPNLGPCDGGVSRAIHCTTAGVGAETAGAGLDRT